MGQSLREQLGEFARTPGHRWLQEQSVRFRRTPLELEVGPRLRFGSHSVICWTRHLFHMFFLCLGIPQADCGSLFREREKEREISESVAGSRALQKAK